MNKKLGKILIRGFLRRKREIFRACIATLLAVFFISGILLFQENMYQWQMAENRKRFGDWFIIENFQQTKALDGNEYLTDPDTAGFYAMMYDKNWRPTRINVGYMTDGFRDKANIRVSEGKLPSKYDEIACDYNTLSKLGYSSEDLGKEISFNYFINNNSSSSTAPKKVGKFTLVGVLENFTDSWSVLNYIPGALLTEEGCKTLQAKNDIVYMYGLKDKYRDSDHRAIYEELSQYNSKKIYFNDGVYDFQPWGPKAIYNYIYLLVMVIGIAALTYQIIGYQHSRSVHYTKLYRLGTTKATVWQCRSLENLLILVPSGLAGILLALLTGRILGWILEHNKGVAFFRVNAETVLKSLGSLLLALVVAELVCYVMTYFSHIDSVGERVSKKGKKQKKQNDQQSQMNQQNHNLSSVSDKNDVKSHRCKLTKNNVTWQMNVRLSRSNGLIMRLGARVFSLAIAVVIVFCAYNIIDAYQGYKDHSAKADITGFQQQDGFMRNYMNLSYDIENSEVQGYALNAFDYYLVNQRNTLSLEEYLNYRHQLAEQGSVDTTFYANGIMKGLIDIPLTDRYCKPGNTSVMQGIDENLTDTLKDTKGVEKLTYSSFETARDWDWDNRNLTKIGISKLDSSGNKVDGYSDTYLYATEYVDPTEEIYDRISKYMDSSMVDYDAFKEGKQVVVFTQKTVNQGYDDSLKAGDQLNFHYYRMPVAPGVAGLEGKPSELVKYLKSPLLDHWNDMMKLSEGKWYEMGMKDHEQTVVPMDNAFTDDFYTKYYKMMYEPCVSSKVAAVVKVDDEVKEELSDILSDYGYFTAIASSELGKEACEKQNELTKEFYGESVADEYKCEYTPNQVTAYYDLSASFSATDNILCSYFRAGNVIYKSSAQEKETYRTKALNAILQYGITMIAAIVINLLIYSILTRNRLEMRKHKLEMLARLGSSKSQIRAICIIEVIRESLWCIFTAPLQILIQYVICRNAVNHL